MASASIFTFESEPQRVASPWIDEDAPTSRKTPVPKPDPAVGDQPDLLSDYSLTKLRAEPQEGSEEYKLHLLLRSRRKYQSMSTVPKLTSSHSPKNETRSPVSHQSRQMRLQQLTTQLLWRLQQSCPVHSLKPKDLVIPRLPDDAADLTEAMKPRRLLPGLEDALGALYQIGVADDGTFVGLTKAEMQESISTLRVMAATLGCKVEVQREVIVGECEWLETEEMMAHAGSQPAHPLRRANLYVVEALVRPAFETETDGNGSSEAPAGQRNGHENGSSTADPRETPSKTRSTTGQLRVTLTGPTTSGKSTLLGTLSTGTLDNGRGQSRLSLFRHRHEVASGLTSSVAQELIGYHDGAVVNFSQRDVESWLDIHCESENGRLVFVSDSAGHPRFRRTILRGLFGWAPQWTVLCLAADDREMNASRNGLSSSAQDVLGPAGAHVDLAKAHLELCLKLKTPLIVVVTKMDLASKASIQSSAGKAMTLIKQAGRTPRPLKSAQNGPQDPTRVMDVDRKSAQAVANEIVASEDPRQLVPIVFTSAISGNGVGLLHALLESLPLPPPPTARDFVGMALNPEQPSSVFHIDDTFSQVADFASLADNPDQTDTGIVVSGYLRFGGLSVGDTVVVGPFPSDADDELNKTPEERPSPGGYGLSMSHPSSAELAKIAIRNAVAASTTKGEWHKAKIVSIRNLRLSVRTLEAGQVGTIGILIDVPPIDPSTDDTELTLPRPPRGPSRVRKGMVLAVPSKHMADTGVSLQAASGLTALFHDPNINSLVVGSLVNVYVGSVRAAARVLGSSTVRPDYDPNRAGADEESEDIFAMNDHDDEGGQAQNGGAGLGTEVVLELLTSREWVELGSQIIVLEGGRNDKSGLEGFVGNVVEIVD